MVNRIVVGAHYGLKDWLIQRITAIVMAAYLLVICFALISEPPTNYAAWKMLFSKEWMRLATFLCVISILLHAWIGVRDIWMDYVKPTGLRLTAHILTILWLIACGAWAMQIIWRI